MTRRLAIAAIAAVAALGTLGASASTADTGVTTQAGDEYIACAGVRTVNVATCVREPFGPLFDSLP